MKKVNYLTLATLLLVSAFANAETSIHDMENMDGSKIQPSNEQVQQQRQNAARVEVIKKCSSFVPETGQIDQTSLDKIKKCLADNNGYMPKEYQFTPEQTKPVNQQTQTNQPIEQQQPSPPSNTEQGQQPVQQSQQQSVQQQSTQQNLGPSYLR